MLKKLFRIRSLQGELGLYLALLASVTTLAFIYALQTFFKTGLDNATRYPMIMEARAFEARYLLDPTTPLPQMNTMKLYLSGDSPLPTHYQSLINLDLLAPGQSVRVLLPQHHQPGNDRSYILTVYHHRLSDGRALYVVSEHLSTLLSDQERNAFYDQYAVRMVWLGLGYLGLMLLFVWFYNRRVRLRTRQLAHWATKLNVDSPTTDTDFHYDELNTIAHRLQQSMARNLTTLERERQFLRHASHELRTPIAIINTNVELLECVGMEPRQQGPVVRISQACLRMQQLTETLLWLSRETDTAPQYSAVQLNILVAQQIAELRYLLQGKKVQLEQHGDNNLPSRQLPRVPLQIVLANLLRNAFQYTFDGHISIQLSTDEIIIENRDHSHEAGDSDHSFGLGLMLVNKICQRLDWPLQITHYHNGLRARLNLAALQPPR